MNSLIESKYQKNKNERMININKKVNSRNIPNDSNYFSNNEYKENNYISKSFNSLDKYKKENVDKEKYNPQIKNQFNNKKYTNNIINYCLINPNHNSNMQSQSNHFFYNLENDLLFDEKENYFPEPEPTPIKIDKSTKYINISKNFEINNKTSDNEKNIGDIRLITFLHNLNLDFLLSAFKNNYVNFRDLFLLTKDDYIEMKIPIGPRNKIIHFIELYKKTMKNFEMNDVLNFFRNINGQNMEKISSTMPSSYNNDLSLKMKDNENLFLPNHSETKRGYINFNKNGSNMDSSFKTNYSNKLIKTSKNKRISKIEKKSNYKIYHFNISSNCIPNRNRLKNINTLKISKNSKHTVKNKNYHRANSFLISHKYNKQNSKDNQMKTNISKNMLNIQAFNNKNAKKNCKFFQRNSMNSFFENISSIKSNNNKINLKISKPIKTKNIFNDSFFNSNSIINTDNKRKKIIKRSKSILVKNKFNENSLIENFKNLSSEVEIFENKYKKMKRDSCERKKKIKTLLMGNKNSKEKINLLKQQLINIQKNNPIEFEDTEYIDKNNINKKMDICIKKVNITNNKDNNINSINNNLQNKKDKSLLDELNIDNL